MVVVFLFGKQVKRQEDVSVVLTPTQLNRRECASPVTFCGLRFRKRMCDDDATRRMETVVCMKQRTNTDTAERETGYGGVRKTEHTYLYVIVPNVDVVSRVETITHRFTRRTNEQTANDLEDSRHFWIDLCKFKLLPKRNVRTS